MAADLVRLICPNLRCRTILSVPAAARGKTVRCRLCGTRVAVPMPKAAKPDAAAGSEAAQA